MKTVEKIPQKLFTLLSLAALLVFLCGCSGVNFTPTNLEKTSALSTCTTSAEKVDRPTRVLFLVDQSGSNINGPYDLPGQATDPIKTFRLGVMSAFFELNEHKSNISWGLSVFNNVSAENLTLDSLGSGIPFSQTAADFSQALLRFSARADVGGTPYRAAFLKAKELIQADFPTSPEHVAYLIAFLTDGYPTDYCPGGPSEVLCPGRLLESQIDSDLNDVLSIAPDAIQFSTVYYGKPDSTAAQRLKRMADLGKGEFVDTNFTSHVNLNDLLEVEKTVCTEN